LIVISPNSCDKEELNREVERVCAWVNRPVLSSERVREKRNKKTPAVIGVPPFCSQVGGKPGCEKITA